MTNELKPCLFCPDGGKPYVISGKCYSFESGNGSKVECEKCQASGPLCETIQEAIEAWNTRYERTCIPMKSSSYTNGVKNEFMNEDCSECGYRIDWSRDVPNIKIKYCPNCGARVVGD